jgi:hypothetical protein
MTQHPHDHARPDIADMRAALATTRAILLGDDQAAHAAAASGSCPSCTAVAASSFGITLASTIGGDTAFTSEPLRLAMLAAVDATADELRGSAN